VERISPLDCVHCSVHCVLFSLVPTLTLTYRCSYEQAGGPRSRIFVDLVPVSTVSSVFSVGVDALLPESCLTGVGRRELDCASWTIVDGAGLVAGIMGLGVG
jgi:hypothetical protein